MPTERLRRALGGGFFANQNAPTPEALGHAMRAAAQLGAMRNLAAQAFSQADEFALAPHRALCAHEKPTHLRYASFFAYFVVSKIRVNSCYSWFKSLRRNAAGAPEPRRGGQNLDVGKANEMSATHGNHRHA